MMVGTELRSSPIHGIGVFLTEPVRAGQVIWRFDSRVDRVFSDHEMLDLPEHVQRFLRTYSTLRADLKLWVLCGDNGRHFNHSDAPKSSRREVSNPSNIAGAVRARMSRQASL